MFISAIGFLLVGLSHALVYECDYSVILAEVIGRAYFCYPTIVEFGDGETLTNVVGNHLPGKTNEDVEFIWASEHNTTVFPRNFSNFFPNLRSITWDTTQLNTLSSEDLRPYTQLVMFRFMYNQLESLEGNLFEHNPNLRYVSFSTNRLTNVGHGLLDNLPLLEQARFIRNPCIDVDANTPEEIEDLKRELVVSCPPLTTEPTTTEASEYCSAGCSERIAASQRQIIKLQTQNVDLMRRIIKLEETMREILDSPCPC